MGAAVVVGDKGMLGRDLVEALKGDGAFAPVIGADLPAMDIASEASVREFLSPLRPAVVFNCAAMTDVDGCETRREAAFAVNAQGPGHLAAVTAELGARLVHISTDYVFDGRKGSPYLEDDAPGPLSVYGESKLAGERLVAERGRRWAIVRTAWLYGIHRRNFVDIMFQLAKEKEEIRAVTDQIGSPTWARDLAAALIAVATRGAQGIFHAANAGACSRFEQARFIVECAGLKTPVRPVDSSAFPRAARVPPYSALCADRLREVVGHAMPSWRDALRRYLQTARPV